jgi:rubrerythrin
MDTQVQILRSAIDNEIRSFQYYLEAAGRTESPRVRQVWLDLSRDKIEHMRYLQAQVAALSLSGKWAAEKMSQPQHQAVLTFAATAGSIGRPRLRAASVPLTHFILPGGEPTSSTAVLGG